VRSAGPVGCNGGGGLVVERVYSERPERLVPEREPEARRRLGTQEQWERDQRVAKLLEFGVSYRDVAARLGCSLGAVQRSVQRNAKRRAARRAGRG